MTYITTGAHSKITPHHSCKICIHDSKLMHHHVLNATTKHKYLYLARTLKLLEARLSNAKTTYTFFSHTLIFCNYIHSLHESSIRANHTCWVNSYTRWLRELGFTHNYLGIKRYCISNDLLDVWDYKHLRTYVAFNPWHINVNYTSIQL